MSLDDSDRLYGWCRALVTVWHHDMQLFSSFFTTNAKNGFRKNTNWMLRIPCLSLLFYFTTTYLSFYGKENSFILLQCTIPKDIEQARLQCQKKSHWFIYTLPRNKRFLLKFWSRQNASKFAIHILKIRRPKVAFSVFHFMLLYFFR